MSKYSQLLSYNFYLIIRQRSSINVRNFFFGAKQYEAITSRDDNEQ